MNDYDPGLKITGVARAPGGTGKINSPKLRAQTYRILAPDPGPQGLGNIEVIDT